MLMLLLKNNIVDVKNAKILKKVLFLLKNKELVSSNKKYTCQKTTGVFCKGNKLAIILLHSYSLLLQSQYLIHLFPHS